MEEMIKSSTKYLATSCSSL